MALTFEPTLTRYWIEIRNPDDFRAVLAAEDRGLRPTLGWKLDQLSGVIGVEYGASDVSLGIDADADGPELRQQISDMIESHISTAKNGPVAQRIEHAEPDEGRQDAGSTPAGSNLAAMTERLIDAAIYNEQASGAYRAGARKELNEARSAIESALAHRGDLAETLRNVSRDPFIGNQQKKVLHAAADALCGMANNKESAR